MTYPTAAEKITKKWAARNPKGPIFRNSRGRPWTAMAFNNRFCRLKEKIGMKLCMYALRHSYAHHALTKGKVDPVTTATLLGHANTHMLMQTYGHLLKDPAFMRDAAKRVRRGALDAGASASEPKPPKKPRKKKDTRKSDPPKS